MLETCFSILVQAAMTFPHAVSLIQCCLIIFGIFGGKRVYNDHKPRATTLLIMWNVMRGALGEKVTEAFRLYHIPVSATAYGAIILETR